MKLEQHVLSAITDYGNGNLDSALMHACIAIEGTARNLFGKESIGRSDYKNCIRKYYWIVEPMIGAGLNLEETKWCNLQLNDDHGKQIQDPDLADVVYHIFRCNHAHGKPVSDSYRLLPSGDGYSQWTLSQGVLQMPDRIIWALLSVSVFCKANKNIHTKGDFYLTWGSESLGLGIEKFIISDWWGRENDFQLFLSKQKIIRVKIENPDWASWA